MNFKDIGFGNVVWIELTLDPVQWESFHYSRVESKCSKTQCIFLFLDLALTSFMFSSCRLVMSAEELSRLFTDLCFSKQ
jgi:hypothetical protein